MKFGLDFAGSLAGPGMAAAGVLVGGTAQDGLVAGGLGLAAISWWVRRLVGHAAAERKAVRASLAVARHFLDAAGALDVRANVMLVRGSTQRRQTLRIIWHTENYNRKEVSTRFAEDGSGAASTAWSQDCATVGIWKSRHVEKARAQLMRNGATGVNVTTLVQGADRNERIKTVLSIPLHDPDGYVKGILNLDDEHSWRKSPLLNEAFIRAAKELRYECERLTSMRISEL